MMEVNKETPGSSPGEIRVVNYSAAYAEAFKQLNEDWIKKYFQMEESDYKALHHPEEYIIDKGGHILIALYEGKPVGACALIKAEDKVFELAKMAVSDELKGKGIGFVLGSKAIDKARESGATKIYLESNTVLEPAIRLYRKLGFTKVSGIPSPYTRCNIQMELQL
ncbi:GNAT family N-acetyltransferase [Daejeonella sp. JGW-45]|uniref:GNAT family N-acetyltransferase n=1 Tax=Daejeonella sp. JGW-45 TaxID=3034148 RepID=UPI0023EC774E|nr:GNAT family N-acetyltransferase [Daejeonella sp. JGW-45]